MAQRSGMHIGLVGAGRIGTMHARVLAGLPGVGRLTVADAASKLARRVAVEVGAESAPGVEELLDGGIDALVIASSTGSHPGLIMAGADRGLPVFCEKPVAADPASSQGVLDALAANGSSGGRATVMIGHQRRFDRGYLEARRALQAGDLGWVHSLRAMTCDQSPPLVAYLASSGGLFRDCSVHDFDILRWLTGREIVEVYARGSNRGDPEIGRIGDVDTAVALCTLDDGTLATVAATRYNGAGHDVRLEVQGSRASIAVGLDDSSALRSAEPGVAFPSGHPHASFMQRFAQAYRDEMAAFVDLAAGRGENRCTPEEAVAASVVADAAHASLETGVAVQVGAAAVR